MVYLFKIVFLHSRILYDRNQHLVPMIYFIDIVCTKISVLVFMPILLPKPSGKVAVYMSDIGEEL